VWGLVVLETVHLKSIRLATFLIRETAFRFHRAKAQRLAAALAYYAMFAISPLLVVVLAVSAIIYGEKAARALTMAQVEELVGEKVASSMQGLIVNAASPTTGTIATTLSVLLVLFGASRIFTELRDALNHIWGVDRQGQGNPLRMAVKDRLLAFLMVLATGFLLLASLVASTTLQALSQRFGKSIPYISTATKKFYPFVTFSIILLLFAVIYKILPATKVWWREALPGAAIASLLFGAGRFVVGFYLSRTTIVSVYGAAGSLVILLIWIYYSAQVLLLGGVFTYVVAHRLGSRKHAHPS
jgi:membrane protein